MAPVSGLAAVLNQRFGLEQYLIWSTILAALLFVPFVPSMQLGYVIALGNGAILLALNRLSIHRNHLIAILALAAFSLVGTQLSGISSTVIVAQILGITVMSVYFFSALTSFNLSVSRWMELYVYLALAVAIAGFILWAVSLALGVGDGRLMAIYSEPSFYVYVTLPAVGYCINRYVSERRYGAESLIFVASYALADSSLGFLGLILIALFTFGPRLKGWQMVAGATLLAVLVSGVYLASSNVRIRIDQMVRAGIRQDLVGVGASPFAILSNLYVTGQSFAAHPLTGVGIGGYSNVYDKYIGDINGLGLTYLLEIQLNKYDANSMILRVTAELGVPGLIALFAFLLTCARVKGSPFLQIRNALLPYLIVRVARLGAYFTVELFFFAGLYLLNYLNYRATLRPAQGRALAYPKSQTGAQPI